MPIDITNEKLAVMEWEEVYEPAIPMVSTGFPTQAHKQHLLWGMPEPLWAAPAVVSAIAKLGRFARTVAAQARFDRDINLKGRHDPDINLKGRF